MELNEILKKITLLMEERNWTFYKLAKESNIPYSSLNSLFQKNNHPTISTLEKICKGLHVSMSEFFSEDTPYRVDSFLYSSDEIELVSIYRELNRQDKRIVLAYIKGYAQKSL